MLFDLSELLNVSKIIDFANYGKMESVKVSRFLTSINVLTNIINF